MRVKAADEGVAGALIVETETIRAGRGRSRITGASAKGLL